MTLMTLHRPNAGLKTKYLTGHNLVGEKNIFSVTDLDSNGSKIKIQNTNIPKTQVYSAPLRNCCAKCKGVNTLTDMVFHHSHEGSGGAIDMLGKFKSEKNE